MTNTNKISVIVPVYNVEQYLDRCMKSILEQSYQNLEIVLVDDGSTDESGKMCEEYALQDSRIKVVHKQNGGLSDARNAGLAIATGEYIGYVDSDDWIDPDMYKKMYEACIKQDAEVAICRYASEFKDRTISEGTGKVTVFTRDELVKTYVGNDDRYVIYNSVWSKLFRRDLVDGMKFPVGRNSEDIMYTTRAFCKANKGVYIDSPFYHYMQDREGSIMNEKRSERMLRDEIPFWLEHIDCINEMVSKEAGDYAAYFFYRRMLSYFMDLKKQKDLKSVEKRIAKLMKEKKQDVLRVYEEHPQSKGDTCRMKLFLMSPSLYYGVNRLYEKIIIPLRR